MAAVRQLCNEKNLPEEVIMDIVKAALRTAYRKDYGNKEQEIRVDFEEGKDMPTILLVKEVVEEVENDNFEISVKDARKVKPDVDVGDEIAIDVTPIEYRPARLMCEAALPLHQRGTHRRMRRNARSKRAGFFGTQLGIGEQAVREKRRCRSILFTRRIATRSAKGKPHRAIEQPGVEMR